MRAGEENFFWVRQLLTWLNSTMAYYDFVFCNNCFFSTNLFLLTHKNVLIRRCRSIAFLKNCAKISKEIPVIESCISQIFGPKTCDFEKKVQIKCGRRSWEFSRAVILKKTFERILYGSCLTSFFPSLCTVLYYSSYWRFWILWIITLVETVCSNCWLVLPVSFFRNFSNWNAVYKNERKDDSKTKEIK